MGGRGAASGSSASHLTRYALPLSLAPTQVAFTHVYRDEAYSGRREQWSGSHGRLISRRALAQAIEASANGRTAERLQDLAHARRATIQHGRYAETVKIVDDIPHDLVLPPTHRQFLKMAKETDTAVTVTLDWDYTVITPHEETGGAIRHYLRGYKDWKIVARPAREDVSRYTAVTDSYGMATPTLTWVSSGQLRELYIPGVTTEQFLEQTKLGLFLEKGAPTAAKRISRIMRDYHVIQGFAKEDVTIRYLDLNKKGEKIFDGSGLVSRRMLRKMALAQEMPAEKRKQLLWELNHARRVEYTILTPGGQDKGHAIVSEDLRDDDGNPVDFLLPKDTKRDTQDWSGQTVVGFHFVHHQDRMRLDDQSLINHRDFFYPDYLIDRLQDQGKSFVNDMERGDYKAMSRVEPATAVPAIRRWPLREFLASGGDPRWSRFLLRSYFNQHIKGVLHTDNQGHERLRLPIEGARYYIKPALIGRWAGLHNLDVPRGHIQIDPATATAWVNEDDWVEMADSPKGFHADGRGAGIADILGGADNDDALWLYPFRDLDAGGEKVVLVWRSPNAPGEYVTLKPTAASHTITWERADGEIISYPAMDGSRLKPRIDHRPRHTASQINPATGGGMGEGQPYSQQAMELAVERATQNAGTLGRFVNMLMVYEAIEREAALPAPLEAVIDAMNKTGADLSPINAWIEARADELRQAGIAVPAYLHHRVGLGTGGEDGRIRPLQKTDSHWLDGIITQVKEHVRWLENRRDELAEQAALPNPVLDYVFARPQAIELGAAYLQHYHAAYNQVRQQRPSGLRAEDYDTLRQTAESFLNQFPQRHHEDILLGAAVSLYMRGPGGSDAALWLPGEQTAHSFRPGIGNKMIAGLRRAGVLHDLDAAPGNKATEGQINAPQAPPYEVIGIRDVWRHVHPSDKELTPPQRKRAQERVREMAQEGGWRHLILTVRREGQTLVAYTPQDSRLGVVETKAGQTFHEGQQIQIRYALARDGHLRLAIDKRENPSEGQPH